MAVSPINLSTIAAGTGGFVINGQSANDQSGISVSSAGDLNGDGFDDLLVGASGAFVGGQTNVGKTYVVFGKSGGFGTGINLSAVSAGTGGFVMNGENTFDFSGGSISSIGDLNGDGFDDVIVGAYAAGTYYAGKAYVVFGKAASFGAGFNLSAVAAGTGGFAINGQASYDYLGLSVSPAGDVNGDGFDDLIVGANGGDVPGQVNAGKSYVVFGKAGSFGANVNLASISAGTGGFVINGQAANDQSGRSVASVGDINGDGFDDLIIGAVNADPAAGADAGRAYVVFGKAASFGTGVNLSAVAAGTGGFVINGQAAGDRIGGAISSAGDINGDGFVDLIIGVQNSDAAGADAGRTYVVFGKGASFGTGINLSAIAAGTGGFVISGQAAGDQLGNSVLAAGDVNGDGLDDIIIGALGADPAAGSVAGKAYVVFGTQAGFGASINLATIAAGTGGFVINGQTAGDYAGFSVSAAGDVNGDGFDDLIVGARNANPGGLPAAGKTYVIFGRDFTSTVTHPGSSASETLNGSAGADDMVAGLGDDILNGLGGADAMSGGGGNDTFRVSDLTFLRVDGGAGTDTLALTGAGMTLDLTTFANTRVQDIEVVDLTGSGNNTLKLSPLEVLNLSTTTNTLRVTGDKGDRVDFGGQTWTEGATAGGFTTFTLGGATVLLDTDVACFAEGTHILTESGETPVECLTPGDRVVTLDHGHQVVRTVTWIGHRRIVAERHPDPSAVRPIRILAGALAEGVPHRELRVSPDHAMLIGGHLIPARLLVNGATILRDDRVASVVYYHVETDAHAILVAEGAPAESYLDTGNRGMFANGGQPLVLHPDFHGQEAREAASCMPFTAEAAIVEPAWRALAERAVALGYALPVPVLTHEPDLAIEVAGRMLRPVSIDGDRHTFVIPSGCASLRLLSRAARPDLASPWIEDRRRLGVSVRRITLRAGAGVTNIPLDHPGLAAGWWSVERDDRTTWRWTDGQAELPIGEGGMRVLEIVAGRMPAYAAMPGAPRRDMAA